MKILLTLVTDTNFWIDAHCGGIVDVVLDNVPGLYMADLVLHELKRAPSPERLISGGVGAVRLSGVQVAAVYALAQTNPSISWQDAASLIAAEAMGAILLTGDSRLRSAAIQRGTEVHGTLWLLEMLVDAHSLDPKLGRDSLHKMLDGGSRFPRRDVERLDRRFTNLG